MPDTILDEDYSLKFDELRKNRVYMSRHKYGSVKANYASGNVDALASMQRAIEKYRETGNTEYLLDAGNYIMFEFMFPQIPGAFFKATPPEGTAGLVGLCEVEARELMERDY